MVNIKSIPKSKKKSYLNRNKHNNIIIIGGGISGLNLAYKLVKNGMKNITIIESSNRLGGRISTIKFRNETYESGAGRFNNKQKRLMSLLKNFKLLNKSIPIDKAPELILSPFNKYQELSYFSDIDTPMKIIKLVEKMKTNGKISTTELINNSLLDIVDKKLNTKYPKISNILEDTFHYWSEIAVLNAYDALQLFKKDFNFNKTFYILKGGLYQIIDKLKEYLKKNGVKIILNTHIDTIVENNNSYLLNNSYLCKYLILAIPKHNLIKFKILNPILKKLNSVKEEPLYRIYAKYPLDKDGKVWFEKIPKISTNLPIKFIIPYNKKTGLIMISYTDGKYAKYWLNKMSKGILEDELDKQLNKLFKYVNIPKPIWIKHHYWNYGAAYWKVGIESKKMIKNVIQPFNNSKNIYICGENYSSHQAWIEGALQTSDLVSDLIIKKFKNNFMDKSKSKNMNNSKKISKKNKYK